MQMNRNKGTEITTIYDFKYESSLIYRCGLTGGFFSSIRQLSIEAAVDIY